MSISGLKVAIVCDWLTNFGGAERVIEQFHLMFPTAPIFTSLYVPEKMPGFEKADIRTSYLQKIPVLNKRHQLLLPFFPAAFESFDLSEFDLVISSSHCCAKGVVTRPDTLHVSYCHSPMRYAWDGCHEYVKNYPMTGLFKVLAPPVIHRLRQWDQLSAARVDHFIANSDYVQKRIQKYYRRTSTVINPPVDYERWSVAAGLGDYFVVVGRMTPYKRFDLVIEVFNRLGKKLKVVGTGPDSERLKAMASGNIEFLGRVPDDELKKLYAGSCGLIFPQVEDFGIIPLEAQSAGKPIVALRKGGALETVKEGLTGVFFDQQNIGSLTAAVEKCESVNWDSRVIQQHAKTFDNQVFRQKILEFIDAVL